MKAKEKADNLVAELGKPQARDHVIVKMELIRCEIQEMQSKYYELQEILLEINKQ